MIPCVIVGRQRRDSHSFAVIQNFTALVLSWKIYNAMVATTCRRKQFVNF